MIQSYGLSSNGAEQSLLSHIKTAQSHFEKGNEDKGYDALQKAIKFIQKLPSNHVNQEQKEELIMFITYMNNNKLH
ncbi:hypothetical protein [Bacillus sp. AFS031507]|uniref:FIMAH domain-containing protein n=1 Tax=Bacillus sp. AFS031507 TaxID=2033496 RepID=UPI00359F7C57